MKIPEKVATKRNAEKSPREGNCGKNGYTEKKSEEMKRE